MSKIMLINVLQPEECRIAILENGVLEELYVERTSHESYVGNIYKGRVVNIEPSIQAAFVDFGVGRNGFLHVSDVEPAYYRHLEQGRGQHRGDRRRGDEEPRRHRDDEPRRPRGDDRRRRDDDRRPRDDDRRQRRPEPIRMHETVVEYTADQEADLPRIPPPPTGFGAGLDDLNEASAPREETGPIESRTDFQSAPQPPVAEHDVQDVASPPEAPQATVEEEAKPTRRRKSTRRKTDDGGEPRTPRRRGKKAAADTEAPTEEPKPEPMDSAERRTEDGDADAPDASDDDILFFSRSKPAVREPEVERQPPPPPEPQAEAEPERPPEPEPERRPEPPRPERGRHDRGRDRDRFEPRGGRSDSRRSRRSLEEELEADLQEAKVGHEPHVPEPPRFDTDEPDVEREAEQPRLDTDEPDTEPIETEEPARPSGEEGGWETDRDPDGWDEDFAPSFFDREGGRPEEGQGEGQRRDRGPRRERGRRDDRRSGGGGGRPGMGRPKPNIQDVFKRGQEVIVQVIKEGLGTKGPTLSTYISIPGRYLVLMPGLSRVGVSRKIIDEEQRRRLREIFHELQPPKGLGFIIRTAGSDKNKKELQNDLAYLTRLWQVVARRIKKTKSPAEIYQESDMITRTIRDTFTADIDTIIVDEKAAFEHAQEFLQIVMPRYANRIQLYDATEPLFHKYGIEDEIQKIQQKKLPLPNGGSIIIEQTEALVAIDVNSGNFRADNNAEETAYQINLQAAKEIARQLRLRDLGGVIVNDFIDMRDEKHRRAVEKAMRDAVKRDRARTKVLRISAFGIIEMTRQRIRPSLKRSTYMECTHCSGSGHAKTAESMSIEVMRFLQLAAHRDTVRRVEVGVTENVASYLLNRKRKDVNQLEEIGKMQVHITGRPAAPPETMDFVCYDHNNNEVKLFATEERRPFRR